MAQPMPTDNPMMLGPFAPIQMECDAPDLYIEGEIPQDLYGSFYRCGPNMQFAPRSADHHLFGGDGMVHGFHIENGKVRYNNRWVRTAKWKMEHELGRNVVNPMNPFDCEPEFSDFVFTDKEGLANTAAIWHGGRLFVMEEGHLPMIIDPHTLATKGCWDFYGKCRTAMTAHPKIDPKTGEMFFFAYMAEGPFSPDVTVYTVSPEGLITNSVTVETPYPAMVHDFMVTDNFIMIPIMPLTGDLERAMVGGPAFAWEPDKPTVIGLLPRHEGSNENIRWVESDTRFMFHIMNGFDTDDTFICDVCESERAPLFPSPDGTPSDNLGAHLHRWSVDLNDPGSRLKSERINELESEFPQIDPRFTMSDNRYGVFITPEDPNVEEVFYNAVCRFDHQTGAVERYNFGSGRVTTEAIFVPRSETAEEGDGYILSVVFNPESQTSELDVFDSQDVKQGPVGVAKLSHRVPMGFHGAWRAGT